MKKVFLVLSLLFLIGCNATPEEQFLNCFDDNCNHTEKSEAVLDYVNNLFEANIYEYLDGYSLLGSLAYDESRAVIGVIFENNQDTYTDGFDQFDKLYDLFLVMESELLKLDIDQDLEIATMISIEEGINDYYFRYYYIESTNTRTLNVELDGFQDEHNIFMNELYAELANIFKYSDSDFDIKIDLVTDIGYIHLLNTDGTDVIELRYTSSVSDEIYQSHLNDLIEGIETALNNEYSVVVSN
jgi:hypothetical protein